MKHYYALFSGGLDSTLAILKVISGEEPVRVTPIFFYYGQKSGEKEAEAIEQLIPALRERKESQETEIEDCRMLDIENLEDGLFSWSRSAILKLRPMDDEDVDVENRNMILIACAVSIIMADWKRAGKEEDVELITGFLNGHYDTSLVFVQKLNDLFDAIEKPIKVIAPLIPEGQEGQVKPNQLIKLARSLNALGLLKTKTWSCYYPQDGEECHKCPPCSKRTRIFQELGMKELKRK